MSNITDQLRQQIEGLNLNLLYEEGFCMRLFSKDLTGDIFMEEMKDQGCECPPLPGEDQLNTTTRKQRVRFDINVAANRLRDPQERPCESEELQVLDGNLHGEVDNPETGGLIFAHMTIDPISRGFHAGKFEWKTNVMTLIGQISGTTNAGTHRMPVRDCESCHQVGNLQGRLDAVIVDGELKDGRVLASYLITFDPVAGSSSISGTLEGLLICPC